MITDMCPLSKKSLVIQLKALRNSQIFQLSLCGNLYGTCKISFGCLFFSIKHISELGVGFVLTDCDYESVTSSQQHTFEHYKHIS